MIYFRNIHEIEIIAKIKKKTRKIDTSIVAKEARKANTKIYHHEITLHGQNAKINSHENNFQVFIYTSGLLSTGRQTNR